MSLIKPFSALRPTKEFAEKVASPPYDVLNSAEARHIAQDNPYTFLHVNKPEVDLEEDVDIYSESVYKKGAENLQRFIDDGIMKRDDSACFYIYRQVMGTHEQYGLVALASVDEYDANLIKKHEFTRQDKEDDRMNHIDHLNAQVGPVFLTYKSQPEMNTLVASISSRAADVDFKSDDEIRHTVWTVCDPAEINKIETIFAGIDALYVADGHHRSAAASRIRAERKKNNPRHRGSESYNYFLNVIFPDKQMFIMDYNRVVKDLNGMDAATFLARIEDHFDIRRLGKNGFKPMEKHTFVMYMAGEWYLLMAQDTLVNEKDPVARLDVSILQENVLGPILGIGDPRKDKRIDFVGGIRGLEELKKRVDSGEMAVAFAFFPTAIEDLMDIADAGKVMPPKSTWFEPKLRSGLFVHVLD